MYSHILTQFSSHKPLHMRDMLGYDDDGADEDGVNDIDITRMVQHNLNHDGTVQLQQALNSMIAEFSDIFSYSVKGKAMDVPPMEFTIDRSLWETNLNWAPSRHISTEKHDTLNTMIDSLIELGVIQSSKETAWSQVHLIRKPNNHRWRFTIDYRSLNKVISNEGWKIPNIKEMITRIGFKKPHRFADLTQGF